MLRRSTTEPSPRQPPWLLRRSDQAVLGALAFLALAGLAALLFPPRQPASELVELDQLSEGAIHFQIDLNQADWPELAQLPGVGETLARRIVEHRQTHGPFQRPEDLCDVRGIGPKTLDRIRPHLQPLAGPP
jgi:competence protein ComEA